MTSSVRSVPRTLARSMASRLGMAPLWLPPGPRESLAQWLGARYTRTVRLADLPARATAHEGLRLEPLKPGPADELVELDLRLDATRAELGRYLYSKLYYCTQPDTPFTESAVVCFEVPERQRDQRVQVALPAAAWAAAQASGHLRLRIDALPASRGQWQLGAVRLVTAQADPALAQRARRAAHRQWVREQVRISERGRRVDLPHYPESVSLELTPVCNLRCPHCSSHGMPHLHRHHNRQPEMPIERLRAIAAETFPQVSVVSAVGRGEPTLVSDALWDCFTGLLREHDVRLSCVTNGTRVRQRFDEALLPWVHELIFSMDGFRPATFEANRAGAKYDVVVDNLRHYHAMRQRVPQARRSQLTISWTLKKNNVAELPDFVRWIAQFEPDLISLRHLVVFQDKERPESLLEHAGEANASLAEAYAELDRLGLRHESPPLMMDADPDAGGAKVATVAMPVSRKVAGGVAAPAAAAAAPEVPSLPDARAQPSLPDSPAQPSLPDSPAQPSLPADPVQPLPPVPAPRPLRREIEPQHAQREPECNWMHRTAIIMADGEVITCGKHYGEQVGHLDDRTGVWDIWNGPRMQSLRDGFGQPHMWDQCRDCWLRELKWHSQREAKDLARAYSLQEGMDYTRAAWDYRRYSEL